MAICNICGKVAERPYRRYRDGKIVEGCVARIHDRHLPKPSNTWSWVLSADKALKKMGKKRENG